MAGRNQLIGHEPWYLMALCMCCGLQKRMRKPNTQEGAAGLWSPAATDLGDEQATILSVCQDAHERKGGVGRKDEVPTAVGGLQGSQSRCMAETSTERPERCRRCKTGAGMRW